MNNTMSEWLRWALAESALWFPPEWSKAALVLALLSTCVVAALFVYLNRTTRRPYFQLWTVAWLFYAVHLAATIGLEESPAVPWLVMARRTCLGISALFMFWGNFSLEGRVRGLRELGLATAMVILWSYVAAYRVQAALWITAPMFTLLATASVYTGWLYMAPRRFSRGARILGVGFLLWGLHLMFFPFLNHGSMLLAMGHAVSAALTILIAVGMVVEHQLTLAEQHYRALFDASGDALLLADATTGRVLEANTAAQAIGTTANGGSLVGGRVAEIFAEWSGKPDNTGEQSEGVRQSHDILGGRILDLQVHPITCPRGPVWLVAARDVTEWRRTEPVTSATACEPTETVPELSHVRQQEIEQERENTPSGLVAGRNWSGAKQGNENNNGEQATTARKRILVIDDNKGVTALLEMSLQNTGQYEVKSANSGRSGVAMARGFLPDLVLLDVQMPDMNGGDVATLIRTEPLLKQTVIVFLTGLVSKRDAGGDGLISGGNRVLPKPIDVKEVAACVAEELAVPKGAA